MRSIVSFKSLIIFVISIFVIILTFSGFGIMKVINYIRYNDIETVKNDIREYTESFIEKLWKGQDGITMKKNKKGYYE